MNLYVKNTYSALDTAPPPQSHGPSKLLPNIHTTSHMMVAIPMDRKTVKLLRSHQTTSNNFFQFGLSSNKLSTHPLMKRQIEILGAGWSGFSSSHLVMAQ